MSKLSISLHGLALVISAAASTAYASNNDQDPMGLLRVSASLLQDLEKEGARQPGTTGTGNSDKSNNNAPKDSRNTNAPVVVIDKQNKTPAPASEKVAARISYSQKIATLKFLFGNTCMAEPAARVLSSKINVGELLTTMKALNKGPTKATSLSKKLNLQGKAIYRVVNRYTNLGFVVHDEIAHQYKITPLGNFALEAVEENKNLQKEQRPKRGRDEDDEEVVVEAPKKAAPKKQKEEEEEEEEEEDSDSDELRVQGLNRPEAHLELLKALGEVGDYQTTIDIYEAMETPKLGGAFSKSNIGNYLDTQVRRNWVTKQRGEYAITPTGIDAREKLANMVEGLMEDDEEEMEEVSLSSSFEPGEKGKRGRQEESSSSDSSSASGSNSSPDVEEVAPPAPQFKRAAAAKPTKDLSFTIRQPASEMEKGSSGLKKINFVLREPAGKPAAQGIMPLERPDDQPVDDRANEWDGDDDAVETPTLDDLPLQLRNHVLGQIMPELDTHIAKMQASALAILNTQLAKSLMDKFGTLPGNALGEFVAKNVTLTIKRK